MTPELTEAEMDVVRKWLETLDPRQDPLFDLADDVSNMVRAEESIAEIASTIRAALLRSVAPKPKSFKERVLEVFGKYHARLTIDDEDYKRPGAALADLADVIREVRAEIAALDDGGEGKGA